MYRIYIIGLVLWSALCLGMGANTVDSPQETEEYLKMQAENMALRAEVCFYEPSAPVRTATASEGKRGVDYGFSPPELMNLSAIKDKHERRKAYIQRFYKIALVEQSMYGIPASITLAQGILESDAGASVLAEEANNHFGVKCHKRSHQCGKAPLHCHPLHDDDACDVFRRYESAWSSFRGHSKVLAGRRYRKAFLLPMTDYRGWAQAIKKAGYATSPTYSQDLISLIEKYNLDEVTRMGYLS